MLIQKTYRPEGTKTVGVVVSLLDENGVYNTFSTSHWYATTNGKRDLTESELEEEKLDAFMLGINLLQSQIVNRKAQLVAERLQNE